MKKAITLLCLCCLLLGALAAAQAATTVFAPAKRDLWDLDHGYFYSWGIRYTIPKGQEIKSAVLFIDNINDWTNEPNDHLYIHLLDNPAVGAKQFSDGQKGGDNWAGTPLIANYTDNNTRTEDLTYNLGSLGLLSTLNSYDKNNGVFGIGFDPDCHYYNDRITLTITTAPCSTPPTPPVPEPSGIAALAIGLTSLGGLMRRRIG